MLVSSIITLTTLAIFGQTTSVAAVAIHNEKRAADPLLSAPIHIAKDARIVIVGGGPAGVHMAASLANQSFTNIHVLESESFVGGKSFTVQDPDHQTLHEMGTCYMHQLYFPVFKPLLAAYDPDQSLINVDLTLRPNSYFEMGLASGFADHDPVNGKDAAALFNEQAMNDTMVPKWLQNDVVAQGVILAAVINMSALDYLKKNGLMALEGTFRWYQQAQGYGVLEDIPAFYMLWWLHPGLMVYPIKDLITKEPGVVMLSKGFQSLWTNMINRHVSQNQVKLTLNANVTAVYRPNESTPGNVTYVDNVTGLETTLQADYIIMAVDLNRFLPLVKDVSVQETSLFTKFNSSVLATTLFESDPAPIERPNAQWFYRMRPDEQRDGKNVVGRVYMQRNSKNNMVTKANIELLNGVQTYGNLTGRQRRVSYQFIGGTNTVDPEVLKQTLLNDVGALESNVDVILQKPWPYFTRFDAKEIEEGLPWEILKVQGQRNTLWIGSSVCFESVLDVVTYNLNLLKRIVVV
ncbi:hypothetical protein HDU76_004599 [Blyttiomyces sp. JEL0837]|nr:hypothetical protein HDU76_004599 [Blyttiomyces sp. JEL0837]